MQGSPAGHQHQHPALTLLLLLLSQLQSLLPPRQLVVSGVVLDQRGHMHGPMLQLRQAHPPQVLPLPLLLVLPLPLVLVLVLRLLAVLYLGMDMDVCKRLLRWSCLPLLC